MLGIMTKDLCQNFYIRRKRISMILCYFTIVATVFLIRNEYGFIFSSIVYVPFSLAPNLMQVSSERDIISNYDVVQVTMPVTKRDVISAKYILGILFSLFNTVVLFIVLVLHMYFIKSITFKVGLYLILISFLLSLISIAINYLSFILLGSKGDIIYAGLLGLILVSYFFNPSLMTLEMILGTLITMRTTTLISLAFLIPTILLAVSYSCSVWYYKKKNISAA